MMRLFKLFFEFWIITHKNLENPVETWKRRTRTRVIPY